MEDFIYNDRICPKCKHTYTKKCGFNNFNRECVSCKFIFNDYTCPKCFTMFNVEIMGSNCHCHICDSKWKHYPEPFILEWDSTTKQIINTN